MVGITNSYSLLQVSPYRVAVMLGVTNSYSLLQCPTEAQQVRKCNGVRHLNQLRKGRDNKTASSDFTVMISVRKGSESCVFMQCCT